MMGVLEVRELVRRFRLRDRTMRVVLDVPTFELAAGEQAALVGGSGTGKTTLLHVIAGILRPTSGSIHIAGVNIAAMSEAKRDLHRARHIGYVFQTFNLLQGYTALENVLLGMMFAGRADPKRARALLARVGMADRLHDRPASLSAGQQQRVAIARALANRPQLVLADEPTGNLDPDLAGEVLDLVQATCREAGAGLLMVTHAPAVMQRFSRIERLEVINRASSWSSSARDAAFERLSEDRGVTTP